MSQIRIAGILEDSIVDGEGLRIVLFTQGCSHACEGCHNPATWDFNAGTLWESEDLLKRLIQYKHKRITFSGGDPLFQAKQCSEIAKALKYEGFNIWAYTGFLYDEALQLKGPREFLNSIDVLVDGKFIQCEKSFSTPYRGSKNQRLIDVQASLKAGCSIDYHLDYKRENLTHRGIFI